VETFTAEGHPEVAKPTPIMTVMDQMLSADFAGDEWDEPPALYLLAADPKVGVAVMDMDVPEVVWQAGRPPEVIQLLTVGIAGAGKRSPRLTPPPGFGLIAALFFCEGWAVTSKSINPSQMEDAMADARAHTIHLREDRVEIKTMYAVDNMGNDYCLTYERGNPEPVMRTDMVERTGQDIGMIPEVLLDFLNMARQLEHP
jgi:hypothetical protein